MAAKPRHWLLKSEPESFSIDDLKKAPKQTTFWNGVRNYQARNFLRDDIKKGDHVLYYHSNCEPSAIVGTAIVVADGYPDTSAFDPKSDYYDPDSKQDNPRWYMVDIQFKEKFAKPLSLEELRKVPGLEKMELLRKGSRLSVQPVTPEEFAIVLKLAAKSK